MLKSYKKTPTRRVRVLFVELAGFEPTSPYPSRSSMTRYACLHTIAPLYYNITKLFLKVTRLFIIFKQIQKLLSKIVNKNNKWIKNKNENINK